MMSSKWYELNGNEGNVVISTRIRLARNLKNYPFPSRCTPKQKDEISEIVKDAILNSNSVISSRFSSIDIDNINAWEKVSLVERHLVSPEFISEKANHSLLLLDDESVSIMINEEDHIRLQVMAEGLNLDKAYETASRIDSLLDERLTFAFNDKLGYLTQCPTNLGTGMRASVMLHLPALQNSRAMSKIADNLSKLGLTIRGIYGEGTEPYAAMYQLSNQISLGISEKTAIDNLKNITKQLISQELSAREEMIKHITVQDAIYRAEGTLNSARMITNDEAMKTLSYFRMGIASGLIKSVSLDLVNKLFVDIQPATLMKNMGKALSPQERDVVRATMLRRALANE